jgi:hypothetical protein
MPLTGRRPSRASLPGLAYSALDGSHLGVQARQAGQARQQIGSGDGVGGAQSGRHQHAQLAERRGAGLSRQGEGGPRAFGRAGGDGQRGFGARARVEVGRPVGLRRAAAADEVGTRDVLVDLRPVSDLRGACEGRDGGGRTRACASLASARRLV